MARIVVIDADRALRQDVALACAGRGLGVRLAETVGEGVRHLIDEPVAAVWVDIGLVRLPPGEQARLFQAVAPGVAMVALAPPDLGEAARLRFEIDGFHVVSKPFDAAEVLAKVEPRLPARRAPAARR
jgi:DNA-binding response OmpR family regulator